MLWGVSDNFQPIQIVLSPWNTVILIDKRIIQVAVALCDVVANCSECDLSESLD